MCVAMSLNPMQIYKIIEIPVQKISRCGKKKNKKKHRHNLPKLWNVMNRRQPKLKRTLQFVDTNQIEVAAGSVLNNETSSIRVQAWLTSSWASWAEPTSSNFILFYFSNFCPPTSRALTSWRVAQPVWHP